MENIFLKGELSPLIPKGGGGLSMETYLIRHGKKKYIVRMCSSEQKAKFYESISKKLSRYHVLPRIIERQGKNVFYEYLPGRDLRYKESLKTFEQIGTICARINNLKYKGKTNISSNFNKQLNELTKGNYKIFTKKEMKRKLARRPNERHDRRRIKAIITEKERKQIKIINKKLIIKAKVSLDAFDVSPANFRLSKGRVYFVDIDAIKPKIKGMGIAKCFFGWAKTQKQKEAFLNGYLSISQTNFLTKEYMGLLNIHFLIQSLHDRAKLGRDYKTQRMMLSELLETVITSTTPACPAPPTSSK